MESKTSMRKKLEFIESQIHVSWLRDLDRLNEIKDLLNIIRLMEASESLEIFFDNNINDLDFFLKNFSKETITNILRQKMVYGENGDDIALQLLLSFLDLFLKFHSKPNYAPLWEEIKMIFDPTNDFYKMPYYGNTKVTNQKKSISADKFNVHKS